MLQWFDLSKLLSRGMSVNVGSLPIMGGKKTHALLLVILLMYRTDVLNVRARVMCMIKNQMYPAVVFA